MSNIREPGPALSYLYEAMTSGNVEQFRDACTSDLMFMGTDDTEKWDIVQASVKLRATEGSGWRLNCYDRETLWTGPDHVAFFDRIVHPEYGPMRASGLCIRCRDGHFRVRHYVLSFMISNQVVDSTKTGTMLKLMSKQPN